MLSSSKPVLTPFAAMGFWPACDSTFSGYRIALGRPHALVSLDENPANAPLRWHLLACPRSSSGFAANHGAGAVGHTLDTCSSRSLLCLCAPGPEPGLALAASACHATR
eukprot:1745057-Lingulodinium_polyedra.AAC.1